MVITGTIILVTGRLFILRQLICTSDVSRFHYEIYWYLIFKWFQNNDNNVSRSNGNIFRVTGPLWGNSPVTGEFPSKRPVTRSFGVFFDLRLNKWLNKQSRRRWSETSSLWRHYNVQWHLYTATIELSGVNAGGFSRQGEWTWAMGELWCVCPANILYRKRRSKYL